MGFKLSDLRTELNTIFSDTGNSRWTEAQKNLAINMGIDALWPELRFRDMIAFTLIEDTYEYLVGIEAGGVDIDFYVLGLPITDEGFAFAELELDTGDYRLLRAVWQRPSATAGGDWTLCITRSIVDANVGMKVRVYYHAKHARLAGDDEEVEVDISEPIIDYAAMWLCTLQLQRAGASDVVAWERQIPQWERLWLASKKTNLILGMPSLIPTLARKQA